VTQRDRPAESDFLKLFKTIYSAGNRAWNEHDIERAYGGLPEDFVYQLGPAWPEAGHVFHGPAEVITFFKGLLEAFPDAHTGPITYIEVDERTMITGFEVRGTGRESGTQTGMEVWQVWEIGDDMLPIRVIEYADRETALKAASAGELAEENAR
jgi:SnoaL-like domain